MALSLDDINAQLSSQQAAPAAPPVKGLSIDDVNQQLLSIDDVNKQLQAKPVTPPTKPPADNDHWAITRGIVTGVRQGLPETLGGFLHMLGAESAGNALKDYAKSMPEEYAPKGGGLTAPEGVTDWGSYLQELFGQGATSMVPTLIGGGVGGALGSVAGPGGTTLGATVGAAIPSYAQNTGDLYNALLEEGASGTKARALAAIGGVPITYLDMISFKGLLGSLDAGTKKMVMREAAKYILKESGKGSLREMSTEGLQQAIQEAIVQFTSGKPLDPKKAALSVAESALAGALTGSVASAGSASLGARSAGRTPANGLPEGEVPPPATDTAGLPPIPTGFTPPANGDTYLLPDDNSSFTVAGYDPKAGIVIGGDGTALTADEWQKLKPQLLDMAPPEGEPGAGQEPPPDGIRQTGEAPLDGIEEVLQGGNREADVSGEPPNLRDAVPAEEQAARIDTTPRQSDLLAPPPPVSVSLKEALVDQEHPEVMAEAGQTVADIGDHIETILDEAARLRRENPDSISATKEAEALEANAAKWQAALRRLLGPQEKITEEGLRKAEEKTEAAKLGDKTGQLGQSYNPNEKFESAAPTADRRMGALGREQSGTGEVPADNTPSRLKRISDRLGVKAQPGASPAQQFSENELAAAQEVAANKPLVPGDKSGQRVLAGLSAEQRAERPITAEELRENARKARIAEANKKAAAAEVARRKEAFDAKEAARKQNEANLAALQGEPPVDWAMRQYQSAHRTLSTNVDEAVRQAKKVGVKATPQDIIKAQDEIFKKFAQNNAGNPLTKEKLKYRDEGGNNLVKEVVKYARKRKEGALPRTISQAIADAGGISMIDKPANIEINQRAYKGTATDRLFRQNGMPFDDMARHLAERGYVKADANGKADVQDMWDKLERDISATHPSETVTSQQDEQAREEHLSKLKEEKQGSERDNELAQKAQAVGIDPYEPGQGFRSEEAWAYFVDDAYNVYNEIRADLLESARRLGIRVRDGMSNDQIDAAIMAEEQAVSDREAYEDAKEAAAAHQLNAATAGIEAESPANVQVQNITNAAVEQNIADIGDDEVPFSRKLSVTRTRVEGLPGVYAENSVENEAARAEAEKVLGAILKKITGTAKLTVVDRLLATNQDGVAEEVEGVTLKGKGQIIVAMDKLPTMIGVSRHEAVHFLRGALAISDADWRVLRKEAQKWRKKFNIDERYKTDVANWRERGISDARIEEMLDEEAIASFAQTPALTTNGVINRTMALIRQLMTAIGNFISGNGFRSAERIIEKMMRGDMAIDRSLRENRKMMQAQQINAVFHRFADKYVNTPGFKKFLGKTTYIPAESAGAYKGGPATFQVYHGTTYTDIDQVDTGRGNTENAMGAGFYASTSVEDVNNNYAGKHGPDFQGNVEREYERLDGEFQAGGMGDAEITDIVDNFVDAITPQQYQTILGELGIEDSDQTLTDDRFIEKALRWQAEKNIAGESDGLVMPVFVKLENPFDMRSKGGTEITSTREKNRLLKSIDKVGRQWDELDDKFIEKVKTAIYERDWLTAYDLYKMGNEYGFYGVRSYDPNYKPGSWGQFLQDVAKELGYDGMIMSPKNHFGMMLGLTSDTLHVMPFKDANVKSALGNAGTFDRGMNIMFSRKNKPWHGSPNPNIFARFLRKYISTGEGAQVFGYGHYAAGKRRLAEHYRDNLTAKRDPEIIASHYIEELKDFVHDLDNASDNKFFSLSEKIKIANVIEGRRVNTEKLSKILESDNRFKDRVKDYGLLARGIARAATGYDKSDGSFTGDGIVGFRNIQDAVDHKPGRLYQVEIPDHEDMLDLDVKFSEQSKQVKDAIKKVIDTQAEELLKVMPVAKADGTFATGNDIRKIANAFEAYVNGEELLVRNSEGGVGIVRMKDGMNIYQEVSAVLGGDRNKRTPKDVAASDFLKAIGIPGNRYLENQHRNLNSMMITHAVAKVESAEEYGEPVFTLVVSDNRNSSNSDDFAFPDPMTRKEIEDVFNDKNVANMIVDKAIKADKEGVDPFNTHDVQYRTRKSDGFNLTLNKAELPHNYVVFDDDDINILAAFSRKDLPPEVKAVANELKDVMFSRKFKSEQTDQGEQLIIPGAERISDKQLAERKMKEAKKADKLQRGTSELPLFGDWRIEKQESLFSRKAPANFSPDNMESLTRLGSYFTFPASLAERDYKFAEVYSAERNKQDIANKKTAEYNANIADYSGASLEARQKAAAIMELADAQGIAIKPRNGVFAINNTGREKVLGSKKGQTLIATGETLNALLAINNTNNRMWSDLIDAVVRASDDIYVGDATSKAIFEAAGKEPQAKTKEEIQMLGNFVKHLEEQRKVAYMPKRRSGDAYIYVKALPGSEEGKDESPNRDRPSVFFTLVDTFGTPLNKIKEKTVRRNPAQRKAELLKAVREIEKQYPSDKYIVGYDFINTEDVFSMTELDVMDKMQLASQLAILHDLNEVKASDPRIEKLKTDIAAGYYSKEFMRKLMYGVTRGSQKTSRNVPGYSGDFELAIAQRVRAGASAVAQTLTAKQIGGAHEVMFGVPDKNNPHKMTGGHLDPNVRQFTKNWQNYLNNSTNDYGTMRKFAFFSFMWGSLAAPLINLSQSHFVTAHQLSTWMADSVHSGQAKAHAQLAIELARMVPAIRSSWDGVLINPDKIAGMTKAERASVKDLQDKGVIGTTAMKELTGEAHTGFFHENPKTREYAKKFDRLFNMGASLYGASEQAMRIAAHNVAYRAALDPASRQRFDDLYADNEMWKQTKRENGGKITPEMVARFVVDKTQFVQGKLNNPEFARGGMALVAQFKKYTLSYAKFMKDLFFAHGKEGRTAFYYGMAMLAVSSGFMGLPFMEDMMQLIGALIGKDIDKELRDLLQEYGGESGDLAAELFLRGAGRGGGASWWQADVSKRFGQGDFIPSTDVMSLAGPFASATVGKIIAAKQRLASGQPQAAFAELLPKFAGDLYKSAVVYPSEGYSSRKGDILMTPEEITPAQKMVRATGFQPNEMSLRLSQRNWERLDAQQLAEKRQEFLRGVARLTKLAESAEDAGDKKRADSLYAEADRLQDEADRLNLAINGRSYRGAQRRTDFERTQEKNLKTREKNREGYTPYNPYGGPKP